MTQFVRVEYPFLFPGSALVAGDSNVRRMQDVDKSMKFLSVSGKNFADTETKYYLYMHDSQYLYLGIVHCRMIILAITGIEITYPTLFNNLK